MAFSLFIFQDRSQKTFSVKGQIANIFTSVSLCLRGSALQLYIAGKQPWTIGKGAWLHDDKVLFMKIEVGWICPMGYNLLIPALGFLS